MRTAVSRTLLLGLIVLIGVLIVRAAGDSGSLIAIDDEGADELEHETFEVTSPVRLAVEARGSVETTSSDTTVLAVTAWITRRADGEAVWTMPARRPERGTFVTVRDTITLDPGLYEAYLSSYGDPTVRVVEAGESLGGRIRSALSGAGRAWYGDAGRWGLTLDVLAGEAERRRGDDPEDASGPETLWRAWAVRSDDREEALFRVERTADLRVRVMGEVRNGEVLDSAFVVRLPAQDTVWVFRGGTRAGGADVNRQAQAQLSLEPGLYRAVYATDRSHAWGDWTATPPHAPWKWGLDLERDPEAGIALFSDTDLSGLPVIAEFACVGGDAELSNTFTLPSPTTAVVRGAGEISNDSRYDWGELTRASGEAVWTMTRRSTESAGGANRNRQATEVLSLEAGTYTLRYESDGSHHCGDFSGDEPDDEDFWGVSLYAVDPAFDVSRVAYQSAPPPAPIDPEPAASASEAGTPGDLLARLDRLGNNVDVSARFRLDAPGTVRIVALGELLRSEALDYGWIEDDEGRRVWEMTRGASFPAGGDAKNRRVDATLALDAGAYTVHFETNGRHAFGAFEGPAPDNADDWGIRVELLPAPTGPEDGAAGPPPSEPPPSPEE